MSNNEMIQNIYPLSPMQEGMLFYKLLDKDNNAYFEQASFRISGRLEADLLEKSINKLIERHDVLRTIFIYENQKRPRQVVLKTAKIKILFEDVSLLAGNEKTIFIEEFKEKDKNKGFNLSREIAIRCSLIKMDEEEYIFILSFHHIILDGWSVPIIFNDIFDIYNSFNTSSYLNLPKVKAYSNYIKWLERQNKKEAFSYWKEYLLNYETQAQVPRITNSIKEDKYINRNIKFALDKELTDELKEMAQKNKVTVNTVFQTIWGILLQRYNNVNDVVFGAVVSGRPSEIEGIESMVGLFINTVPVRINNTVDKSFIELVKGVQYSSIKSKKYEYVPLPEIQSQTSLKHQLINNIMIFENYPIIKYSNNSEENKKIEINFEDSVEQTNYNFNVIVEMTDEILINLNYNASVYDEQYVNRIAGHIIQIIREVTQDSEVKVSEIEILSRAEKRKMLTDFNNTKTEYQKDKMIHEMFEEQAKNTPNNVAIVYEDKELTYKELNEKANSLARILRGNGVVPEGIVGIMVERSIEMIIGILGILKAGGAYLPIDPEYPEDRIKYMLEDSDTNVLLTQRHLTNKVKFEGITVEIEGIELYERVTDNLEKVNNANGLAYVIYTSGSTGKPKGVMIEHKSAVNFINGVTNYIQMNEKESILALTTISFDIFFLETLLPLTKGLKVIVANSKLKKDANELSKFIYENNINIIQATPSSIKLLENSDKGLFSLSKVEKILIGGEALPQVLLEELKKLKLPKLYNMYGPTETTIWSSIKELTDSFSVNIGKPISNTQIYIVGKNNNIQPIGVAGELCIAGDGLARGYLNSFDLTEEKFIPNPFEQGKKMYRTGDLARWLLDGNIECIGRIDQQIKIRGFRVELGEIESQLLRNEAIKEAVVVDKEDKQGNKYLCAYIVSHIEVTVAELREFLLEELPEYMIPAYFINMEKMPLTPNRKIDRKALPEPHGNINTGVEYAAPRNEIEEKLVKIWSEVLGVEKIGIDDDFFMLGGHSLKVIQVALMIHREINVEVPVGEVFSNPTIRRIGEYIEKSNESKYSSISVIEEREVYKISSAQKRLFALNQLSKKDVNYNIPIVMVIEGILDGEKVENIFGKLIERHEVFRTGFELESGEIVQKIYKEVDFIMEYAEANEEQLKELIRNFIQPFDLSKAPLLRVKLVKVEKEKHILIVDMHHIISDGASLGILMREFAKLYKGEKLEKLRIQYKDYAAWQNEILYSEDMKKQEEYWIGVFSGEIPVLAMPTDYPRPAIQSYEGDSVEFKIDENLAEKIKKIGKDVGATLYMVLLSTYNILLSKYSGQEDIIIGSPIAGRPHADLQGLVGMFVNTLAMRNDSKGEKSFKEFLQEVKKNALNAYENQDYQFDKLIEKLGTKRDLSRSALFDTMFILQNTGIEKIDIDNLNLKLYEFKNKVSKFDLTLSAIEIGKEIEFKLEYCTRLFKKETIERISIHFLNILKEVAENPEIQISEIEMLSDEERRKILVSFNNSKKELTNTHMNIKNYISNSKIYIVNKNNKLQPIGVVGEICVSDDGLSKDDLDRLEIKQESIMSNPFEPEKTMYPTGKRAKWLPDGSINMELLSNSIKDASGKVENIQQVNEIEKPLRKIWSEILKEEEIEIDDGFFELGGTSLNIAQLIFKVHEEFGIEIDFKKIYEFNTLGKMSKMIIDEIFEKEQNDGIVTKIEATVSLLNKKKNKNIFAFPPKSTYGISYKYIAELLDEHSVYGFNYIEDADKIEKYINIIKEIQKEGPYILMGYSAGGLLSFEVAKALLRDGNESSSIIMIDAYPLEDNSFTEYNQNLVDELNSMYIENAKNEGDFEMVKLLESNFFREILTRKMNDYSKYLSTTSKEKIKTHIYHIKERTDNEETNSMASEWSEYTEGPIVGYCGYGKHKQMIEKGFAEKNVDIIKEILKNIN